MVYFTVFLDPAHALDERNFKDRATIHSYLEKQFGSKLEELPILSTLESNGISTSLSDLSTFCSSSFGQDFSLGSNGASSELSSKKDQYYYVVAKQTSDDLPSEVKVGCGSKLKISDFNKIVAKKNLPIKKGEKPSSMVLIKMHIVQREKNVQALGVNPMVYDSFNCIREGKGNSTFTKVPRGAK